MMDDIASAFVRECFNQKCESHQARVAFTQLEKLSTFNRLSVEKKI